MNQKQKKPKTQTELILEELVRNIKRISKTVATEETRYFNRALRRTYSIRRKLKPSHFIKLIEQFETLEYKQTVLDYLSQIEEKEEEEEQVEMDTSTSEKPQENETKDEETNKEEKNNAPLEPSLEVSLYFYLLAVTLLVDDKKNQLAVKASTELIEILKKNTNRTTLFPIFSKAYFYYSRSLELTGKLAEARPVLLAAHRTASLLHNTEGQLTLLNLLLRNYLHFSLIEQADKLLSQSSKPKEGQVSNNQLARYLYYQGFIKSIQLEYSKAEGCVAEALRKAPAQTALGFKLAANKLLCIVQLLMGDIPERRIFRQNGMQNALAPYFQLTKAVRVGDLNNFHKVIKKNGQTFINDKTMSLIRRLRNNVIKIGLRKINIAYSRISLADICDKLKLESVEDAEFIVSKAIKDGVIDATINHKGKYVQSNETPNVYKTYEPSNVFHKRIEFCLNIRNEAIKAMRYIEDQEKSEVLITNKEREKREKEEKKRQEEEEKKAKEQQEKDKKNKKNKK